MKRKNRNPRKNADAIGFAIRHCDDHIVIVDKPPGLTTMRHRHEAAAFGKRAQKFLPTTLLDLLAQEFAKQLRIQKGLFLRAVHRLDKDTSGLVVFARTAEAERLLGQQFREHSVQRRYLAVVRGRAKAERIASYIIRDRGDGRRGSTSKQGDGQKAVSHVKVLEAFDDFTLIECRLETGRTHQVRIHLGERGTPLCGERIYDRPLHGKPYPDTSGAKRPMLHAATLGLNHPQTGKMMTWKSPMPKDMKDLLRRLRKQG